MTPGGYLRLRRIAAGLSLEQLPIDGTAMLAIEHGVRVPTMSELTKLLAAFRFSVRVFLMVRAGGTPRLCRECGCSELDACVGDAGVGCHWVEHNFCSACADRARSLPEGLVA